MNRLVALLLLLPLWSNAQEITEHYVKSNIDEVKLYLTAGEMKHLQQIKLVKGRNKLIFSGISAFADPASIQFNAEAPYRLVSLSTEMDFLAAEEFNPRIILLKDSLEHLMDDRQNIEDILDSYLAEQAVLNTNKDLGGNTQNLTVAQIKEAADFYRKRTLEINTEISKLKKRRSRLDVMIEDTRFQLVELNYNENQRSNQVIVLLDVDVPTSTQSSLSYLVSDCGWAATYDLSATDLSQKINLKYKAQVYNNTGNDWEHVKLTLSTADPNLSASHPILSPWYLNPYANNFKDKQYEIAVQQNVDGSFRQQAIDEINMANGRVYDNYYNNNDLQKAEAENRFLINSQVATQQMQIGNASATMSTIEISELTTEFDIQGDFSCPSDAKPYLVEVKDMDIEATFSHVTVPKLDKAAFLLAHIANWQDLELIPGPTHVYFGGRYVGMSHIDTRDVADTLSLSFGRDDKVVVLRKLKQEMSYKRVVGSSKRESYLYEIAVRNNRNEPIRLKIYDQVPISQSNDIVVTVDQLSGGMQDALTGEVVWESNLGSGSVFSKEIGYTVKYPKDVQITLKRYRSVSAYKF